MDKHGMNVVDGASAQPAPLPHSQDTEPASKDERITQAANEEPEHRSKWRLYLAMTALYLTLFLAALDITSLATSIPTIAAELNSAAGYSWIGGAFLIADAATGPIWAKMSDIFGRKLVISLSLLFFAIASIIGALSNTMNMLIAARAIQGAGAGGMVSLVNITVSDLFGLRDGRALILGTLEAVWAVAGGAGPMIGGAITENIGWRWNFWINLPIVAIALALLVIFLDVHNPRTPFWTGIAAVDWYGIFALLGAIILLLLGLNFGGVTYAWNSPEVICLLVFGGLMIGVFIAIEWKLARYPLMPLPLFHDRSNNSAYLVAFTHGMSYISVEYYLPLYFQSVRQASPTMSGVLVLPVTLSEGVVGIIVGILIHKTGRYREIIWVGKLMLTLGLGLFVHLGVSSGIAEIIIFQLIAGVGSGLLFEPPLIAVQNNVQQSDTATATATLGLIRNLSTSISVIIGGVVFSNSMNNRASWLTAQDVPESTAADYAGDNASANVEMIPDIDNPADRVAVQRAFAWGLRNMWITFLAFTVAGLIAGFFIKHKKMDHEHTRTRTGLEHMTDRKKDKKQRDATSSQNNEEKGKEVT
ncbi:hypothetical protein CKM354_000542800 [Cercospora kikuchii]|uniref:Major facilitator superfamily (MFS) profile domain-containing protein n=1 Tax=Cercospora kikuchii TaxID=84275 RepID=A0A9P3FGT6_9PEZI|nr:uncharacterized protein CKM354_000542800 [Cercospora kikuchii]GIZ42149.1 hypothetical protein CKM354_000542800 [Cercospora kikuchii]